MLTVSRPSREHFPKELNAVLKSRSDMPSPRERARRQFAHLRGRRRRDPRVSSSSGRRIKRSTACHSEKETGYRGPPVRVTAIEPMIAVNSVVARPRRLTATKIEIKMVKNVRMMLAVVAPNSAAVYRHVATHGDMPDTSRQTKPASEIRRSRTATPRQRRPEQRQNPGSHQMPAPADTASPSVEMSGRLTTFADYPAT